MKKDMTLLIMAAGMGSRFGGLKQIEPVGPNGEFIIDYSVYDAIKAGFNKVVFIIKEENYDVFKETIGKRVDDKIQVEYVFQKLEDLPNNITVPEGREKPWGTGHAILAARNVIKEPFGVINADDFYGRDAFLKLGEFLQNDNNEYAMIGYHTANTLSENGSVKRGVAEMENGYLTKIVESNVEDNNGIITADPLDERPAFTVAKDSLVSMNMWGFLPDLFDKLNEDFTAFLSDSANLENLKSESLIPEIIMDRITKEDLKVRVIETNSMWHGVTYPEDKDAVVKAIKGYVNAGEYKQKLWE